MKKIIILLAILFAAGLTNSPAQGIWTKKADFGGGNRSSPSGFSIGNKGYLGTGYYSGFMKDFWEYDPATNIWTQKADFGGAPRENAVGLSIGNKGYIGTGYNNGVLYKDFWEYDPATNIWTKKADFGGTARYYATAFSINNSGYIGIGKDAVSDKSDFWEYNPTSNIWTQKADFGGGPRDRAAGFAVNGHGYIGTGWNGTQNKKDVWQFDPASNNWIQKADFGGTPRRGSVGFAIGEVGFIGMGYGVSLENDLWQFDPTGNSWSQKASFSGSTWSEGGTAQTINGKGYAGTGINYPNRYKDWWEYSPDTSSCTAPTNLSVKNITSTSAKLRWDSVPGAKAYKIHYQVLNSGVWTQTRASTNSKTIIGLSPSTQYRWMAQTYCKVNVYSAWSAKDTFTTAALNGSDASQRQLQTSFQIYPNPAKDHATVQFTLPQSSHVYIKVYDVSGKEMTTLFNGNLAAGSHSVQLNTNRFSKGVYVVRMISDLRIENQRLIVE